MPTKTTKKSVSKSSTWDKKLASKKVSTSKSKSSVSSSNTKKIESTKKAVVKRRKLDLTPTRASAVAIASQAAKKQALIDKLASEDKVVIKNERSSTKIPSWVWIFFGCSLLLFCVSFYQAIIRPQLEEELAQANVDDVYVQEENTVSLWWIEANDVEINNTEELSIVETEIQTPTTAVETIQEYFNRLSNHLFDEAFDLFSPSLQRSSEIREHFTSFRMNPFVLWIEWKLEPTNFQYISTSAYWRDRYSFDLSYTLSSNQERYDETWEVVVDTSWDEIKIASIVCITKGCSRHPIFWPESYGLMR